MCWKVFHLGTALGNTLFGNKYVGHSFTQLTLQLASQLCLHIGTTWELKKKILLPGPPHRLIEPESLKWAGKNWIVWPSLSFTEMCIEWAHHLRGALSLNSKLGLDTRGRNTREEKKIPLVVAKLQAFCLCCYDLRTWTSSLWLQPQECSPIPPAPPPPQFVSGFSPYNKILREPDS